MLQGPVFALPKVKILPNSMGLLILKFYVGWRISELVQSLPKSLKIHRFLVHARTGKFILSANTKVKNGYVCREKQFTRTSGIKRTIVALLNIT